MTFELTGTIHEIYPTEQISDRFSKREFVLETEKSLRFEYAVLKAKIADAVENKNWNSVAVLKIQKEYLEKICLTRKIDLENDI